MLCIYEFLYNKFVQTMFVRAFVSLPADHLTVHAPWQTAANAFDSASGCT